MAFSNKILWIFEGVKRDPNYFNNMYHFFFEEKDSITITPYGNNIYQLYHAIAQDDDLDVFEVVKEASRNRGQSELETHHRDEFTQVFLFFEMDLQDNRYSDDKFLEINRLFNDETEHGKIFFSYPMVEAIRDAPRGKVTFMRIKFLLIFVTETINNILKS